mgnify:FL=1
MELINKPNFNLEVVANIDGVANIQSNMEQIKEQAIMIKNWYDSLVITEDMLKDIKSEKSQINKAKDTVATYRKDIVKEFKKPIEQFELLAKETESILNEAYATCNEAVKRFEDETKAKKAEEVKAYFDEYAESLKIDFVEYERLGINVTLTASMKSLKEAVKVCLDKIASEIDLINIQKEELIPDMLVEYKKTLNVASAIKNVTDRHKAIEEEKARQEALKALKAEEEKTIAKAKEVIEEVTAPVEVKEVKTYRSTFTVYGTVEQLRALKEFLEKEGIKYDTIK